MLIRRLRPEGADPGLTATPSWWRVSAGYAGDTEVPTAALRLLAAVAMVVMWATGGLPRYHPREALALMVVGMAYSIATFFIVMWLRSRHRPYPRLFPVEVTFLDNGIILGMTAATGGVHSRVIPILLLVVVTNAARYGPALALSAAVIDTLILLGMGLVVTDGSPGLAGRLQLAAWWAWMLVGGAVFAGVIAWATARANRARESAERDAQAERLRVLGERQARRELENVDRARRESLRDITHEFRTPISSIAALSRALAGDFPHFAARDREAAVALLQSHAEHLARMLEEVRDLSTVEESGRDRLLALSEVDLPALIEAAASAAGLGSGRLRTTVGPEVRTVTTDAQKLRRILTNLIENAARHSTDEVLVEAGASGPTLHLAVKDRGPGLAPDVAEHVFERGFSFGSSRGSSGLGLWMVRELSALLGGRVRASARAGGGLAVRIDLPLVPCGQPDRGAESPAVRRRRPLDGTCAGTVGTQVTEVGTSFG